MRPKKLPIIHPVLLAIYPVLFLYSHNIGQVRFIDIVEPILVILGVTIISWAFLCIVTRSWQKSAIITSIFLLLFFSYGHIKSLLGIREFSYEACFLCWLLIGGTVYIIIRKPFEKGTMIFNAFAAVLVAFTLANIVVYELVSASRAARHGANFDELAFSGQAPQSDAYPDIYFIILDAYARQDVLREMYNLDNSDFIKFLHDRNFYIADKCAANYSQTGLSIGSCLNMAYLDKLVKRIGPLNTSRMPLVEIIKNSSVLTFLKEHEYRTVSFASYTNCTNLRNTNLYLKYGRPLNTFSRSIINTTPLPDIIKQKKKPIGLDAYRSHTLYILDNLGKIPEILHSGPKFVFAHVEIPHPPFVFGPNGEYINVESKLSDEDADWLICTGRLNLAQYRAAYCDQTRFVNSRMEKIIDEILSNSRRPPIILIFGDHGPRSETIWEDPVRTNMKECLTMLGAFHLPGGGEELLRPDITLVNLFRAIFNHYFGEKLDILPDRSYYSTAKHPYKFYDVTNRVMDVNNEQPADRIKQ